VSHNKKQGKTGQPKTQAQLGRRKKQKGMCLADRPCLEPNAAGIDIGAREIFVAVPPDRDERPVRVFDTFTEDLQAMARWLKACGITTVAMESTRCLLDSAIRHSGSAWNPTVPDQCAPHEKRSWTANRLA